MKFPPALFTESVKSNKNRITFLEFPENKNGDNLSHYSKQNVFIKRQSPGTLINNNNSLHNARS